MTKSPMLRLMRHSEATSAAAMLLFLALSGMWLVAAGTARVWYHSAPAGYVFPSPDTFYVWFGVGVFGVVLTFGSLVRILLAKGGATREWAPGHRRAVAAFWVLLAVCVGAAGELLLVLLVTRHAIATAPFGVDSGERPAAIAALGLAQILLVGVLAPFLSRFFQLAPERDRGRDWSGLLGPVGMAIACSAFAVWSLHDGTALIVNTSVIAGTSAMTNAGTWWPGLFAAMSALTVVAIVCSPVIVHRDHGGDEPAAHTKPTSVISKG